jgi:hypothetical protein
MELSAGALTQIAAQKLGSEWTFLTATQREKCTLTPISLLTCSWSDALAAVATERDPVTRFRGSSTSNPERIVNWGEVRPLGKARARDSILISSIDHG